MKDHVALVIHKGKDILFAQRSKTKKTLPNIWAFPSGTMESGESLEQTATREAFEELGIAIVVESAKEAIELPELQVRLHLAVCGILSGEPSIREPDEIQALKWMALPSFFERFGDDAIGHGLVYLRTHQDLLSGLR